MSNLNTLAIVGKLLDKARSDDMESVVPADINGATTPRHAWRVGYLKALEDVLDGLEDKPAETVQ